MPLSPLDLENIKAAQGWFELGDYAETEAQLRHVSLAGRNAEGYLSVLWELQNKTKRWVEAVNTAAAIQKIAPNHISGYVWKSICLEKLGCTEEAYENLVPVAEKFSKTGIVAFLLAVYASKLQRMSEAKAWLRLAFQSPEAQSLKQRALEEKALEPFWQAIGEL